MTETSAVDHCHFQHLLNGAAPENDMCISGPRIYLAMTPPLVCMTSLYQYAESFGVRLPVP